MSVIWLSCLYLINYGNCYNINTESAIVHALKKDLFGYTVQLYPESATEKPGIFVGAPRGTYKNIPSGVVFQCPLDDFCRILPLSDTSFTKNKFTNAWIGGSMDFEKNKFMTCGYRSTQFNALHLTGSCYFLNNTNHQLMPNKHLKTELQKSHHLTQTYKEKDRKYYDTLAGFSLHIPPDNSDILIGAPGAVFQTGTTITLSKNTAFIQNIDSKPTFLNNQFGYAVNSGNFHPNSKRNYIVSAIDNGFLYGQVNVITEIYEKATYHNEHKEGTQFGETYGSCIAVGDVNNDHLDDVFVGAPHYSNGENNYDLGRIYIYLGGFDLSAPVQTATIEGKIAKGQFGATIQYIGDINKDQFGDIAVAAPFELECGVVYIYSGSETGLNSMYAQRIIGKDIMKEIRGFGISISKPVDIDQNNYSDLAIGAHLSGHVVILRTRPMIGIIHKLIAPDNQMISLNAKSFNFSSCLRFDLYSQQFNFKIYLTRHITIFDDINGFNFHFNKTENIYINPSEINQCTNFTVNFNTIIPNKPKPIQIQQSYTFDDECRSKQTHKEELIQFLDYNGSKTGNDNFFKQCPMKDKFYLLTTKLKIPFGITCGIDRICKCYLTLQHSTNVDDNVLTVGLQNEIIINTKITNTGDDAFQNILVIKIPEETHFVHTPINCNKKNLTMICNLMLNPLPKYASEELVFNLQVQNENSLIEINKALKIYTQITTESNNLNSSTNVVEIQLKREANLQLTGLTEQQYYNYGEELNKNVQEITHIFKIVKSGPSTIERVEFTVDVPYMQIRKNDENIHFIKLARPITHFLKKSITCYSPDINFIQNTNNLGLNDDEDEIELEMKKSHLRKKRSYKNNTQSNDNTFLKSYENNTFNVNCTTSLFVCAKVICIVGPFVNQEETATIQLKFSANLSVLKDNLLDNVATSIQTNAAINILLPKNFTQRSDLPLFVNVKTILIENNPKKLNLLIVFLSAILGAVILLSLLTFGLAKAGFFKRTTKKELEKLKEEEYNRISVSDANEDTFGMCYEDISADNNAVAI